MDGLLVESESLWRIAEQEASDALGLGLGMDDFDATMGIRMRDVAKMWFARSPWPGPTPDEVAASVVARVIELLADAEPLPGVVDALDLVADAGMAVGLCSSSDLVMIDAVLAATGLAERFDVTHSAEHDPYGKPHPEPYLRTAELLGVEPSQCIALEDSVTGCISAKAASMRVVAVPAPAQYDSLKFEFVDAKLRTLRELSSDHLAG